MCSQVTELIKDRINNYDQGQDRNFFSLIVVVFYFTSHTIDVCPYQNEQEEGYLDGSLKCSLESLLINYCNCCFSYSLN